MVLEPGRVFRDPVRQLMGDHVERFGEIGEDPPVPVTEHHLLPVPEGVVVLHAAVNISLQPHAPVVDRVAVVDVLVELTSRAEPVERLVDRVVGGGRPVLRPGQHGKRKETCSFSQSKIVRRPFAGAADSRKRRAYRALAPQPRRRQQRVQRGLADVVVVALQKLSRICGGVMQLRARTGAGHVSLA